MITTQNIIHERGIREVLHFTTHAGLTGILASEALKSRRRLPEDKYIEHIMTPNCAIRRDVEWFDYVSLSLTDINTHLFDIASSKWHADKELWWCILAFDPTITAHEGVYFATTNNMYSGVRRAAGPAGLEALFASSIVQYTDWQGAPTRYINRDDTLRPNEPTCDQAEVLYPGELSLDELTRVYVATEEHHDLVAGLLGLWDREAPIHIAPVRFRGREGRHHG